jgi:Protein of unknown function (DUF2911)
LFLFTNINQKNILSITKFASHYQTSLIMKKIILTGLAFSSFLLFYNVSFAQDNQVNFKPLDISPMDMSYYPPLYPAANVRSNAGKLIMRIIYSRPQKKGRNIFGGLEPFGKVDRLGANEADELDIFSPVSVGGKVLDPGRYTMYAIFEPDKWTMIINSQTDTWGAFGYNPDKDIVRVDVPVQKLDTPIEALSMVFKKTNSGADLVIGWDTTEVKLPISF